VEMCERGTDFASTFGIGGVIGTNFAWPGAPGMAETKRKKPLLTPEREQLWAKSTKLCDEKRLSQGEYLGGLYDIGFDRPEAHVVRKGDSMHYAFFAPSFDGKIELRGLGARVPTLAVVDCESTTTKPRARLC
jgi:alpha-galactosidase